MLTHCYVLATYKAPHPLNLSLRFSFSWNSVRSIHRNSHYPTIFHIRSSSPPFHQLWGGPDHPSAFRENFPSPFCVLSATPISQPLSILILLGHKPSSSLYLKQNIVLHGGLFCPITVGKHSWMCNWRAAHILMGFAWTGWKFLGTEVKQKPANRNGVFMNDQLCLAQLCLAHLSNFQKFFIGLSCLIW